MYLLNILAEFTTFLIAGHETASIAMAWALYALTHNTQAQTKFRQEVSNLSTDNPTIGDLNGLPYLDAVVHETLRLYPPVSSTIRAAQEDDFIPLSKPFTEKKGIVRNEIWVRKGRSVVVPIYKVQVSFVLKFGSQSSYNRPECWAMLPRLFLGSGSNILSFIGGPRALIGYRFPLLQ
ncbi:cytochrome P450 [Phlegmacium glaucopus]|nr:cytochrome P450 [Phlegmacium glaucopus]